LEEFAGVVESETLKSAFGGSDDFQGRGMYSSHVKSGRVPTLSVTANRPFQLTSTDPATLARIRAFKLTSFFGTPAEIATRRAQGEIRAMYVKDESLLERRKQLAYKQATVLLVAQQALDPANDQLVQMNNYSSMGLPYPFAEANDLSIQSILLSNLRFTGAPQARVSNRQLQALVQTMRQGLDAADLRGLPQQIAYHMAEVASRLSHRPLEAKRTRNGTMYIGFELIEEED